MHNFMLKIKALIIFTCAGILPASAVVPNSPMNIILEATTEEAIVPFGDGFFVAWESTDNTLKSTIKGQRFTKAGNPIGKAFLIDSRAQSVHDVGGTVVVPVDASRVAVFWYAPHSTLSSRAVHAAIVQPGSSKVERTSASVFLSDYFIAAARLPDGSFVIAYTVINPISSPIKEIVKLARLSSKLALMSGGGAVNGEGVGYDGIKNTDFAVIGRTGGSLGIMKQRDTTKRASILVQPFNSSGVLAGTSYAINTTTMPALSTIDYSELEVKAARLSDGRIIVVWVSLEGTTFATNEAWEIRGRLLTSAGKPIGKDFRINSSPAGLQLAPEVSALSNGSFLVSWVSQSSTGAVLSYQYRAFNKDGKPLYGTRTTESGNSIDLSSQTDTAVLADKSLVTIFRGPTSLKAEGSKSVLP